MAKRNDSSKLSRLVGGKVQGSDERYTPYEAVDQELRYYTKYLRGKRIYLPCDQDWSAFVKWFDDNPEFGCRVIHTQDDMFQPKNIRRMEDQDIIVTNPPYGNGKEQNLITLLMQLKKKFILVGPILLLGHSKIFPLYRDGKIRMGVTRPSYFINPDGSKNRTGASIWITNIPIARKWPSIEYCRDPLSSYTVGICKDGRGYPYIENHRRIPDTARPILVPTSSLRYFNPSEWLFLSSEKPYCMENGGKQILFHRILVRRRFRLPRMI